MSNKRKIVRLLVPIPHKTTILSAEMSSCYCVAITTRPNVQLNFKEEIIPKTHRYSWFCPSTASMSTENMCNLLDSADCQLTPQLQTGKILSMFTTSLGCTCRLNLIACSSQYSYCSLRCLPCKHKLYLLVLLPITRRASTSKLQHAAPNKDTCHVQKNILEIH